MPDTAVRTEKAKSITMLLNSGGFYVINKHPDYNVSAAAQHGRCARAILG